MNTVIHDSVQRLFFFTVRKYSIFQLKLELKQRLGSVSMFLQVLFMSQFQHEAFIQIRGFRACGSRDALRGWHLQHLRTGLAAPLAMMKRVHVCCCPFFTAHGSNCHFVLFIEAELVFRFVFSFLFF